MTRLLHHTHCNINITHVTKLLDKLVKNLLESRQLCMDSVQQNSPLAVSMK